MEPVGRHHAYWPRKKQHTPLQRAFRNHHGLVVPDMLETPHRELHVAMAPPPKLTPNLMLGIIDVLNDQPLERPTEGIEVVVSYLETVNSGEAERFSKHLTQQLGFLCVSL